MKERRHEITSAYNISLSFKKCYHISDFEIVRLYFLLRKESFEPVGIIVTLRDVLGSLTAVSFTFV